MNPKNFILITFLISVQLLNAQTDFRPGYIIKNSGDTLNGDIDYRGDIIMNSICRFKNKNSWIIEYSPTEIAAFRFTEGKYFVSREVKGLSVFLEYLIKGKLNVYYMRDKNGDHYYFDKENVILTELPYEEGLKYIGDKQFISESTLHIKLLTEQMLDAPELNSKVKSIKKPDHQNMIKIAKDYHNAVCDDEKCIIYEKKEPFLKINIEGVVGVVKFKNVDQVNEKFYLQSGIIAHFWMPRTNEKLFFKTGFLHSIIEMNGVNKSHMKVPIHIGYLAPNTFKVRPSISMGLLSPSYSGGLIFRINKKVNLGIQSWVNFFPNDYAFFIPNGLYSYSALGNLYINL